MENQYWGIEITKVEELKWEKWRAERINCPAFNTISHTERIKILEDFLKSIRNKEINQENKGLLPMFADILKPFGMG
jgi:hypothetical protein